MGLLSFIFGSKKPRQALRVTPLEHSEAPFAHHGAVVDPKRREVICLATSFPDKMPALCLESGTWRDRLSLVRLPQPRYRPALSWDTKGHRAFLFGGRLLDENRVPNVKPERDLWVYYPPDHEEGCAWYPVRVDALSGPPGRSGCSMTCDSQGREAFVFGGDTGKNSLGQPGFGPRNDLWSLDLEKLRWRKVQGIGAPPSARSNHASAYDPELRRIYIWGGRMGGEFDRAMWYYDIVGNRWHAVCASGLAPSPRHGAAMVFVASKNMIFLHGGLAAADAKKKSKQVSPTQNDAWCFDLDTMKWSPVPSVGEDALPRRWGHTVVHDEIRGNLFLLGGLESDELDAKMEGIWSFQSYNLEFAA
ncbi:MAG: hypothetical protein NUW37_05305 [Planctomycetes bacterium]|nr:hypothetical protein [Planctomycetota bacterium]